MCVPVETRAPLVRFLGIMAVVIFPTSALETHTRGQYTQVRALGGSWDEAETSSASAETTDDVSQD